MFADGTDSIDNTRDVIDSREVIARIAHLREVLEEDTTPGLAMFEDEREELAKLLKLADQGESCADWEHGEGLIRESYFETHARELADDIGAINRDATWPNTCIDWEQAARELQQDYTCIDFDGVTYYVRS